MKLARTIFLIVACFVTVEYAAGRDVFAPISVQPELTSLPDKTVTFDQQQPESIYAKIIKIDGSVDEIALELLDANLPDGQKYPTACIDMILPEGTRITTGDATVIIELFSVWNGQPKKEGMISVRHTTEMQIGPILIDGGLKSTLTRMKIATGEVRVKITDESPDYDPGMKVSTPNATASVGSRLLPPDGAPLSGSTSSRSTPPLTEPSNEKK